MNLADTASRLLEKFGEPVGLEYEHGGVVHPATGEVTTAASHIAVSAFGYPSRYSSQDIAGGTAEAGDIRLILATLETATVVITDPDDSQSEFVLGDLSVIDNWYEYFYGEMLQARPKKNWRCTVDGENYRVQNVQAVRKSGADVVYICQLRRN